VVPFWGCVVFFLKIHDLPLSPLDKIIKSVIIKERYGKGFLI
jgi:hypothetical protein